MNFISDFQNRVQRREILKLILEKEKIEEINYDSLANCTDGFSGSDLKELCRIGSLYRLRELHKQMQADTE